MKNLRLILLGTFLLTGLQFMLTGCVAEVGSPACASSRTQFTRSVEA